MNTKAIAILKKYMKPMSDQEEQEFLQKRHPRFYRPTPTDDGRSLPEQARAAAPNPERPPRVE